MEDFFFIIYNKEHSMKLSIKTSTIWVFILVQTILSVIFYVGDNFVSAGEAVIIFLTSIPLTYGIQFLRELRQVKNDE